MADSGDEYESGTEGSQLEVPGHMQSRGPPPLGNAAADDSESGTDDEAPTGHVWVDGTPLPQGIRKEVLREAAEEHSERPTRNDRVSVHYTGMLAAGGTPVAASVDSDKPFDFTLGRGKVIKGWDIAVATMRRGEKAKFTLAPEYAYGAEGSGDKVPPGAALVFEIELLSFTRKGDLFGDGGVMLKKLKRGCSNERPKLGTEVRIKYKLLSDSAEGDEGTSLDYKVASGQLQGRGFIAERALDKALCQMRLGDEVRLTCTSNYASDEPDSASERATDSNLQVQVALTEIFEISDVSFNNDQLVLKKRLVRGSGYEEPRQEGMSVTIIIHEVTQGNVTLLDEEMKMTIVLGDGEVCDALECAIPGMRGGETALVSARKPAYWRSGQPCVVAKETDSVIFRITLEPFARPKDTHELTDEEKVDLGVARKTKGTELFKAGRFALARQRWESVAAMLDFLDNWKDESLKQQALELRCLCQLNLAAVALKAEDYIDARYMCEKVLKTQPSNPKALFRKAQAGIGLKEYGSAMEACRLVLEVDASNREARALYDKAKAHQHELDKSQQGMFANMCKGFGSLGGDQRSVECQTRSQKMAEKSRRLRQRRPAAPGTSTAPEAAKAQRGEGRRSRLLEQRGAQSEAPGA